MENNKSYLERLVPAFFIMIAGTVGTELFKYFWLKDFDFTISDYQLVLVIIFSLPAIAFSVALGQITGKWKAAIGSLAMYVVVIMIDLFLLQKIFEPYSSNAVLYYLTYQILYALPTLTFFLFCRVSSSKILPIAVVLLMLQLGGNLVYAMQTGIEFVAELLNINLNIHDSIYSILSVTAGLIMRLIFVCELLNYANGKNIGWNTQLLNPGNRYPKASATILFYVLKSSIYFILFGAFSTLYTLGQVYSDSFSSEMSRTQWQFYMSIIFTIPVIFGIAWYLRKFLLEVFISYGLHSKFLYWFLLLPGIGFIAWLFMIAERKEQTEFKEKEANIQQFGSSSAEGILVVFIIFLVIRAVFALANQLSLGFLFTIAISFGLFMWMYKSRIGYFVNLSITLPVLLIIIVLMFAGRADTSILLLYPLLILNAIQIFLLYPTFHFDAFSYLSPKEEKPWQPGQNLFD